MAPRAPGSQNYGNNRLDNRQRGNATQLLDKYKTLARDAAQQGDRVVAEYYLQYADHYFRVLNEIRERQPEHQRGPRPGYDADEDGDDMAGGYNPGYPQGDGQPMADRDARDDNGQRDGGHRDGGQRDNGQRDNGQRDYAARDNGQRDGGQRDGGQRDERPRYDRAGGGRDDRGADEARGESRDFDGRDDDPRRGSPDAGPAHREMPYADESPIAGLPGPATLSVASPATDGDEAPRRRRGRPRKLVDAAPAEGVDA